MDLFGNPIQKVNEEDSDDQIPKRFKYSLFKDFIPDLTYKKTNILRQDAEAHKDFLPYIVNTAIGMGLDTLAYANEMNKYPNAPKQLVYDFYIKALPKKKRFDRWCKSQAPVTETEKTISAMFGCNHARARDILDLVDQSEIDRWILENDGGGIRYGK